MESVKLNPIYSTPEGKIRRIRMIKRKRRELIIRVITGILALILIAGISVYSTIQLTDSKYNTLEAQYNELKSHNLELIETIREYSAEQVSLHQRIDTLTYDNDRLVTELDILSNSIESTTVKPVIKVNKHTDLSVQTVMTADRMNEIIDEWNKIEGGNVRFKDHGQAFIDASKASGLDPVAILAISCQESGFGTTRIAREKNNFMGIAAYDHSPYESSYVMGDGISQGIINGAVWISDNYYKKGQTTLNDMIYGKKMYSSSKDHWIDSIVWLWNKSYTL